MAGKNRILPPFEVIISESLKVKLNDERLDNLKKEYKELYSPKKEAKQKEKKKLASVK